MAIDEIIGKNHNEKKITTPQAMMAFRDVTNTILSKHKPLVPYDEVSMTMESPQITIKTLKLFPRNVIDNPGYAPPDWKAPEVLDQCILNLTPRVDKRPLINGSINYNYKDGTKYHLVFEYNEHKNELDERFNIQITSYGEGIDRIERNLSCP